MKRGWVSVENELPERNKNPYWNEASEIVLFVDIDKEIHKGWKNMRDSTWYNGQDKIKNVTHWMPLPELPHE